MFQLLSISATADNGNEAGIVLIDVVGPCGRVMHKLGDGTIAGDEEPSLLVDVGRA
jgi:hypothetical protein